MKIRPGYALLPIKTSKAAVTGNITHPCSSPSREVVTIFLYLIIYIIDIHSTVEYLSLSLDKYRRLANLP